MEPATTLETILKIIEAREPIRIVAVLKRSSPLNSSTVNDIISAICSILKVSEEPNLLVIQKWPQHTILIFDVFHTDYNWSTAHHKTDLPVIRIICSAKGSTVTKPSSEFQEHVNGQVAKYHNLNGFVPPPYCDDQTGSKPRIYANPRDTRLL